MINTILTGLAIYLGIGLVFTTIALVIYLSHKLYLNPKAYIDWGYVAKRFIINTTLYPYLIYAAIVDAL